LLSSEPLPDYCAIHSLPPGCPEVPCNSHIDGNILRPETYLPEDHYSISSTTNLDWHLTGMKVTLEDGVHALRGWKGKQVP
jgi:hypothetical protein